MDRLTIVTPTYRVDRDVAVDLCASIDRHAAMPYRHLLVIPRRDVALFAPLTGAHRSIVVMEDVLGPHGFTKLPVPSSVWLPGIGRRRLREKWHLRGAGILSGWLVQQHMKLSAPDYVDDEYMLMVDSDIALVRDLEWSHIRDGDLVRLRRTKGGGGISSHREWRDNALELLGRPSEQGGAYNFVGNMIAWRRSHVLAVRAQVEAATGLDWRLAIGRKRAVSEYILYGYSCEGLSDEATGHRREDLDLAHSLWVDGEAALDRFMAGIGDRHVAVHIQSTLPLTLDRRRALIAEIGARLPARA